MGSGYGPPYNVASMRKDDALCSRCSYRHVAFDPTHHWPDAGVYQLWLRVTGRLTVSVGRLGQLVFAAGTYVYTGRASRGLRARVARHARGADRLHWHIDYLLADRMAKLERVLLASTDPHEECAINQLMGRTGVAAARGFGASDCRAGCPAHLWLVKEPSSA
jgi:Uri superfamily endonuclease